MSRKWLVLTFLAAVLTAREASAQSKSSDKNFPTTLQPVNPVRYYGPRKEKKKKQTATYDATREYRDRIENTWREREKREKSLETSDGLDRMKPPYFGHKRPPKIRPLEKRKYCKICGIRH